MSSVLNTPLPGDRSPLPAVGDVVIVGRTGENHDGQFAVLDANVTACGVAIGPVTHLGSVASAGA